MDADPDTNNRPWLLKFRLSQTWRQWGNNLTWASPSFLLFSSQLLYTLESVLPTFSLLLAAHFFTPSLTAGVCASAAESATRPTLPQRRCQSSLTFFFFFFTLSSFPNKCRFHLCKLLLLRADLFLPVQSFSCTVTVSSLCSNLGSTRWSSWPLTPASPTLSCCCCRTLVWRRRPLPRWDTV